MCIKNFFFHIYVHEIRKKFEFFNNFLDIRKTVYSITYDK
jgi:hypothetical protein